MILEVLKATNCGIIYLPIEKVTRSISTYVTGHACQTLIITKPEREQT
uniref:Uncharacterized protein n=1 Tax=Arundo donax TaxID=35708 RepID=A0A0A9GME9_ARUDO